MNKITIIGLGLVGNSIGMGLRKAQSGGLQAAQVVGLDPDRKREEEALRKHGSVHEIAPNLESAVKGADLVIIATPASAVREVLSAIEPFLEAGTTVTDTVSAKEQVLAWAGEVLSRRNNFVGGHPVSRTIDLQTADEAEAPRADLFAKAPYCIMPLPSTNSESLNRVISLAEALGASPLFIDPREHDSFLAAVSNLPVLAGAALVDVTAGSPSWQDMSAFAREQFRSLTAPLAADPAGLHSALVNNKQAVLYWLDNYLLALQDLGDLLAKGDDEALFALLEDAHTAREVWLRSEREAQQNNDPHSGRRPEIDDDLREELQRTLDDSKPGRRLLGRYLGDRMFGKKE